MLTIRQAMEYMAERGDPMAHPTLAYNIRAGNVEASKQYTGTRGNWYLTTEALDDFIDMRKQRREREAENKRNPAKKPQLTPEQRTAVAKRLREYNQRPDVREHRSNRLNRSDIRHKTIHQQRVRRRRNDPQFQDDILHLLAILDHIVGDKDGT